MSSSCLWSDQLQEPPRLRADAIPPEAVENREVWRAALQKANERIASLDREIHELYTLRDRELAIRCRCTQMLTQQSPPIQKLPQDLLVSIFEFVLAATFDLCDVQDCGSCLFREPTVYYLAQVSREWRTTAIGTPLLWSVIRLEAHDEFHEDKITCLKLWMERSSTRPLNIFLSFPHAKGTNLAALETLRQQSHRWKFVKFKIPVASYLLPPVPTPILEKIAFASRGCELANGPPSMLRWGDSPPLHSVQILSHQISNLLDSQSLGWRTITRLELRCEEPMNHLIDILRAISQSLQVLEIIYRGRGRFGNPLRPILLPRLTSLVVEGEPVLRLLNAPALKTADISTTSPFFSIGVAGHLAFFARSQSLQFLTLHRVTLDFIDHLTHPNISQLVIHLEYTNRASYDGATRLFENLATAVPILFPNLTSINISAPFNCNGLSDGHEPHPSGLLSAFEHLANRLDTCSPLTSCPNLKRLEFSASLSCQEHPFYDRLRAMPHVRIEDLGSYPSSCH